MVAIILVGCIPTLHGFAVFVFEACIERFKIWFPNLFLPLWCLRYLRIRSGIAALCVAVLCISVLDAGLVFGSCLASARILEVEIIAFVDGLMTKFIDVLFI